MSIGNTDQHQQPKTILKPSFVLQKRGTMQLNLQMPSTPPIRGQVEVRQIHAIVKKSNAI